jgi:hypothetical protein
MGDDGQLVVTSHVARDLLQSAALFKTDRNVVWEYVANGLQYVDPGVVPKVTVRLDGQHNRISVKDNGRGMDLTGLKNFFVMHGENVDRKRGAGGRGRFGTGKSAAFGIADILRVTTVRSSQRSVAELRRTDIEAASHGDPIPVRLLEQETTTEEPNGTLIEIEQVKLRSLDQAGVIRFIERHLAKTRRDASVIVNHHECEYAEPPVAESITFRPGPDLSEQLGNVELTIKRAKRQLDQDERGITVFSNGVWLETTFGGMDTKEMVQYLFGDIDVAKLDTDSQQPAAFDQSRSMQLNPHNPLVQAIHAFVGMKVDEVRRKLVKEEKERRESEEAKRLEQEASEIAKVLNEDFDAFRRRLQRVKAQSGTGADLAPAASGAEGDDFLVPGGTEPAKDVFPPKTDTPIEQPGRPPELETTPDGEPQGKRVAAAHGERQRPRAGFEVRFESMGIESDRAKYQSETRTISINLDHPQVDAAKGLGTIDDPSFRRLAYEVAFSEYSIALAFEMAHRGEFIDPDDPIIEIRDAVNRLARKAAQLYAS